MNDSYLFGSGLLGLVLTFGIALSLTNGIRNPDVTDLQQQQLEIVRAFQQDFRAPLEEARAQRAGHPLPVRRQPAVPPRVQVRPGQELTTRTVIDQSGNTHEIRVVKERAPEPLMNPAMAAAGIGGTIAAVGSLGAFMVFGRSFRRRRAAASACEEYVIE